MIVFKAPFIAGPPVTKELFVGRKKEMHQLLETVKIRQPIAIISPRRMGKTSLWENAKEKLTNIGIIPVAIDCWGIGSKEELARAIPDKIIEGISKHTKKTLLKTRFDRLVREKISDLINSVKAIGGSIGKIGNVFVEFREGKTDINRLLGEAFDFPEKIASEQKLHLAIMFDEFQSLNEINGRLLRIMRTKIQHHKNISYVIAGSQESMMNYLVSNKASPFYGMFERINLKNLDAEEAKKFILGRFSLFKYNIKEEAIDGIISLTKAHPFYIQKLCLRCFIEASENKKINENTVLSSYETMLSDLEERFEDELKKVPGIQKTILKIIAIHDTKTADDTSKYLLKGSIQSINMAMRELTKKGFLRKLKRGEYVFTDIVFRDYIKKRFEV